MVKSFTAYTNEIDDIEAAVSELLDQLDVENTLLENTVGIVSCYAEYIESGVWAALCEKLPFEVIGVTTIANMAKGEIGENMLALLVITGDELRFATAFSDALAEEERAPLAEVYQNALSKLPGKPSLMFSFVPLLNTLSAGYYVETMSEISGGVPDFGSVAVDHNTDYRDSRVLLNGESWTDRAAILLVYGSIRPKFYIGTIRGQNIFSEKNVVTDADRNRIKSVNGAPVIDFLESIGLKKNEDGSVDGINAFPLIVDYNDGTPSVIRTMFALSPEGYAICGGNIPTGCILSVGSFDEEDIVATTRHTLEKALETAPGNVLLMYSCIGRYFAQGYNNTAEFNALLPPLSQTDAAYMASYSGGEICPVYRKNQESINRSHGNTFIICAF